MRVLPGRHNAEMLEFAPGVLGDCQHQSGTPPETGLQSVIPGAEGAGIAFGRAKGLRVVKHDHLPAA